MAPKRHVEKQSKVHIPETLALEAENEEKFKSDVEEIRKKPTGDNKRGVIYLGHIPHGFFEPQMKEFFSQFGQVTRIKLSRSKKTGRAKGYAFIEFKHEEVAKVVADTMNNYLMFIRLLKCEFIPEERLHPETFKGWNRRFSAPKSHRLAAERHNSIKSAAKQKTIDGRRQRKLKKTMQKLSDLGVEYSLEQAEWEPKAKPVPSTVRTPKGKLHVLKEDVSDDEVTFRTPPDTIKSSRLTTTPHLVKSASPKKADHRQKKAKAATMESTESSKADVLKKTAKAKTSAQRVSKRLKR